jgi:lysophospholipase L1-like esterase
VAAPPLAASSRLAGLLLAGAVLLTGCLSGGAPGHGAAGSPAGPGAPSRTATTATPAPASSAAGSAGAAPSQAPPGRPWVLSLGDSLGFGFQQERFIAAQVHATYRPDDFPGYAGPLATRLSADGRRWTVTNLACPAETSATMLRSGCPFVHALLHHPYAGTQLAAATRFLAAHRNGPGVVTLSIGANDVLDLLRCRPQPGCATDALPAAEQTLGSDLDTILAALHEAAPQALLLVLRPYNPFAVGQPASDETARRLGAVLEQAAARHGATVVDAFADFNRRPGERERLCELTLVCTASRDIHPSDAGYRRLAELFAAVARERGVSGPDRTSVG